jgi:hypothetical protein
MRKPVAPRVQPDLANADTKPGANAGARPKGARSKLSRAFIAALCAKFEEQGEECLRVVIAEDPATFLKLVAAAIPKELDINPNALAELSDDDLAALIALARHQVGRDLEGRREREDQAPRRH